MLRVLMAIRARQGATAEILACFDDAALVSAALRFERELAAALAEHGVIDRTAADAVARACDAFDPSGLDEAAAHAGTLAIPIAERLRATAPDAHRGATSQDLADTALALQVAAARPLVDGELARIADALAALAAHHARTPVVGRTLLQPADITTLGARFASWMLGIDAARDRLAGEQLPLQFGGAVGTLAALGDHAAAVRASLAARLGLADSLSWHGRRDAVAALGCAVAIAIGAVGKLARDVSLLMQLGELAEPRVAGRGGSSAMPHKHNPTGCGIALSAAIRAPQLAATLVAAMPQELERGIGGWQAEAPVVAELFELAHGAARAMRDVIDGLAISVPALDAPDDAVAAGERYVIEALGTRSRRGPAA